MIVATAARRWLSDGSAPDLIIAPRGQATRWRRCVGPRSLVAITAPCGRAAWWPLRFIYHQEASAAKISATLCRLVNQFLERRTRAIPTLATKALPPVAQGNRGRF